MKDLKIALSSLGYTKEETEINDMILDMVDDLCKNDIEPVSQEMDEIGCKHDPETGKVTYPPQVLPLLKKMAQNDLFGLPIAEKYGGAGLSIPLTKIVMDRLSRADAGISLFYSLQNTASDIISKYATEEAKNKYLPLLAKGERLTGLLYTESGSGSDLGSLKAKAVKEGNKFYTTGNKIFITNSGIADVFLYLASTNPEKGSRGLTAFILDAKDNPGFKVARIEEKLGLHSNATGEITLDRVEIPEENVLGEVDKGFSVVLDGLTASRIGIAAQAVGIADAAYRKAVSYVKQRKQFGREISKFQFTQFRIAEMYTKILTSRLGYLHSAKLKDMGMDFSEAAAVAKLHAAETANEVCYQSLQMLGGYGYVFEYDLERHYRDARITPIYEGTSEVQRIIISRAELNKKYEE